MGHPCIRFSIIIKMKLAVLIVLISVALARDEYFFAQLRDSEFGKTIIQTLQVQLM